MRTAPLDPELLEAFVAVTEHRSFTRAAASLNRTQSAVSMQIKRLEERLGAPLFDRSKTRVEPTLAGDRLLGYARRILLLSEEAVSSVSQHESEGRVRLGVMDDYGTFVVPGPLASFAARHPRIHVDMQTGLTAHMTGRLGKDFDIVIAMHPQGQGGGEFLRREQAVWATALSEPVEAMHPLPVALYPPGCLFREWATDALDAAQRTWRLAFVSHSLAAVESVAAGGWAVTVVKSGTFPPRLRALSERDGMPPLPAADIRLHRAPGPTRQAALLADHLVAQLRDVR